MGGLDIAAEYISAYVRWAQLVLSMAIFIGGLIHLNYVLEGEDHCKSKLENEYSCIGRSLVWKKGKIEKFRTTSLVLRRKKGW